MSSQTSYRSRISSSVGALVYLPLRASKRTATFGCTPAKLATTGSRGKSFGIDMLRLRAESDCFQRQVVDDCRQVFRPDVRAVHDGRILIDRRANDRFGHIADDWNQVRVKRRERAANGHRRTNSTGEVLVRAIVACCHQQRIAIRQYFGATLIERACRSERDWRRLRLRGLLHRLRCSRWSVSLQSLGKFADLLGGAGRQNGCGQDCGDDCLSFHIEVLAFLIWRSFGKYSHRCERLRIFQPSCYQFLRRSEEHTSELQ